MIFSPWLLPSWGRSSLKSMYKPSTTAIYGKKKKTYRYRRRKCVKGRQRNRFILKTKCFKMGWYLTFWFLDVISFLQINWCKLWASGWHPVSFRMYPIKSVRLTPRPLCFWGREGQHKYTLHSVVFNTEGKCPFFFQFGIYGLLAIYSFIYMFKYILTKALNRA